MPNPREHVRGVVLAKNPRWITVGFKNIKFSLAVLLRWGKGRLCKNSLLQCVKELRVLIQKKFTWDMEIGNWCSKKVKHWMHYINLYLLYCINIFHCKFHVQLMWMQLVALVLQLRFWYTLLKFELHNWTCDLFFPQ